MNYLYLCLKKTFSYVFIDNHSILQDYKELFDGAGNNPGDKTLEDKFFEHEVSVSLI